MTAPLSPGLRRFALEEWHRRLPQWKAAARQGAADWPGDPTNELADIWTAIIVLAGAGDGLPPATREQLMIPTLWPVGSQRIKRADEIATTEAIHAELTRARDVAIAKAEAAAGDLKKDQRARDLIALAEALGAPGIDWTGQQEERAA
jgi:hypothetical protein